MELSCTTTNMIKRKHQHASKFYSLPSQAISKLTPRCPVRVHKVTAIFLTFQMSITFCLMSSAERILRCCIRKVQQHFGTVLNTRLLRSSFTSLEVGAVPGLGDVNLAAGSEAEEEEDFYLAQTVMIMNMTIKNI